MSQPNVNHPGHTGVMDPKLPHKSHPLYRLRMLLIIVSIIGLVLSFLSCGPYDAEPFAVGIFFLALSICFAKCDLSQYAMKKIQNPDEDPEWPRTITMVGDTALAVILHVNFWVAASTAERMYSWAGSRLACAYAALTYLLCSCIHFYSLWKQLVARYKKKWLSSLPKEPCSRCGYHEEGIEGTSTHQHNTFPYAGSSAVFGGAPAIVPQAPESLMEEGLLIGSDFASNSSYGTIQTPEQSIDQEEQVVMSKSKKKKAVAKDENAGRA